MLNKSKLFLALITLGASKILLAAEGPVTTLNTIVLTAQSDELGSELLGKSLNVSNQFIDTSKLKQGEFKHEVRQFQKPYDNQQAEQISLMV
ncbi:hypothetical protein LV43_03726 [Acinetobacter baumannii]|nr:hypothetical protein LV43_03726 [Acinetobacter baumannii]SPT45669.1 putative TonB-dependent receptor protein [Acinetobacter baumannii]